MLRLTWLSALSLVITSPLTAQLQSDAPVGFPGRIDPQRPTPEAGPTRVYVGLYIIDISKINDVDQSITAGTS